MLDKFFNPLTLLAGPITVAYLSTVQSHTGIPIWAVIVSYLVWLLVTRLIKYMPHFVRRPQDIAAIPVWLVFNVVFAFMKVYCLFTLHVTDWGTRQGADDKETEKDALHQNIIVNIDQEVEYEQGTNAEVIKKQDSGVSLTDESMERVQETETPNVFRISIMSMVDEINPII